MWEWEPSEVWSSFSKLGSVKGVAYVNGSGVTASVHSNQVLYNSMKLAYECMGFTVLLWRTELRNNGLFNNSGHQLFTG